MPKEYELIEHTADLGIRVKAKDLKELFRNAGLAMFEIMAEPAQIDDKQKPKTKKVIIKQKADNLDGLFVNWLNELLSLSATKELIFCDFKIKKLDKNSLEVEAEAESLDKYKVNTEIKAATYHQLKIEKIDSRWQAEVIFDV
ncbi:MAG: archease [Candidatus Omnitrophica bacterium]|nr:archease [Candidatus Omnitrophota bacterium]